MTRPRAILVLLATAALLVPVTVAYAKYYAVPATLGTALDRTRDETPLAILLPNRINLDFDGRIYAFGSGDRRSYDLSLAGHPECGGATACFLASFSAQRGDGPHFDRRVRLRGGRRGWFKPLTCGGSCSPPAIQWRSRGNLYRVQANIPDNTNEGQRRRMINLANSAIGAGPR